MGYEILSQQPFSELNNIIKTLSNDQPNAKFAIKDHTVIRPETLEETRELYAYSRAAIDGFEAKIAHLDEWTKLLVRLFSCVRTDAEGNVSGIDQQGRQRVLAEALSDTQGIPTHFLPHVSYSGNLFISTIDDSGKKQILMVQRSDTEGNNPLLSFLGGFTNDDENKRVQDVVERCKTAATRHALDKLFHHTDNKDAAVRLFVHLTSIKLVASDIVDTLYPTTVLPSKNELRAISHHLSENIKDFYESQTPSPTELMLACSSTFEVPIDSSAFNNLKKLLAEDWKSSQPYNHVHLLELYEPVIADAKDGLITYFAQKKDRPVTLSATQTSDWKYKHERYISLNSFGLIASSPETLVEITTKTIEKILDTIRTGIFPAETAGLPAGAAHTIWRMNAELNLLGFARRPYMGVRKLANICGIRPDDLTQIHTAINDAWEKARGKIIEAISEKILRGSIQYTGTFSGSPEGKKAKKII